METKQMFHRDVLLTTSYSYINFITLTDKK